MCLFLNPLLLPEGVGCSDWLSLSHLHSSLTPRVRESPVPNYGGVEWGRSSLPKENQGAITRIMRGGAGQTDLHGTHQACLRNVLSACPPFGSFFSLLRRSSQSCSSYLPLSLSLLLLISPAPHSLVLLPPSSGKFLLIPKTLFRVLETLNKLLHTHGNF